MARTCIPDSSRIDLSCVIELSFGKTAAVKFINKACKICLGVGHTRVLDIVRYVEILGDLTLIHATSVYNDSIISHLTVAQ